ncbi:MAG: hypothetical protein LBQ34_05630 [Alphaproteobacteria bacterium]|jgi:hypothetical protein|nr:hypothetical protein [Alphaproteobacteria bacterium]
MSKAVKVIGKLEPNLLSISFVASLIFILMDIILGQYWTFWTYFLKEFFTNNDVLSAFLIMVTLIMGFIVSQFVSLSFSSNEDVLNHFVYNDSVFKLYKRYFKEHLSISFVSIIAIALAIQFKSYIFSYAAFISVFIVLFLSARFFWMMVTLLDIQLEYRKKDIKKSFSNNQLKQ